LRDQWLAEPNAITPMIAQHFQDLNIDYVFRMRYRANTLRMGFARRDQVFAGMVPLAEAPIPNERSEGRASLLFTGEVQEIRASNPEILGGHIALIGTNNNGVQIQPNSLDRMHASLQKKAAFNQRMLKNEEEISGMNADLSDFLQDMQMCDNCDTDIFTFQANDSTNAYRRVFRLD
jgi:hypothetical protein